MESEIVGIEPVYQYSLATGGYFLIHFNSKGAEPFKLNFVSFLSARVKDSKEFEIFFKKAYSKLTASHAIHDLYDIGFPVDSWVMDYIQRAKNDIGHEQFNRLVSFYNHLKSFNSSPTGSSGDLTI